MAKKFFHALMVITIIMLFNVNLAAKVTSEPAGGWNELPEILSRIVPPVFPERDFLITDFGGNGDGKTDNTDGFQNAIAACNGAGGGRVVVPDGIFLTGAIHLKSNVNLFLASGAVLKFSTDPHQYLPVVFSRWEGTEVMNYSACIYAYEAENIAITGSGVIDGQAGYDNWWRWKSLSGTDARKLVKMGDGDIPVEERIFGPGHYLRPNLVQLISCRNVLIEGVTFKNAPMWNINPVYCRNVTINRVRVEGDGPNNDGCNPDSCSDVLIKDCIFNCGDDCIAIKSGRNRDGRRVNIPSENILIQGCQMEDGHGGITCGSETAGDIRNIYAENSVMSSANLWMALRFKTNPDRGGTIENVFIRNYQIQQTGQTGIHMTMAYDGVSSGPYLPEIRNIEIRNCRFKNVPQAIYILGLKKSKIEAVRLEDCRFEGVHTANFITNVEGLILKNVSVNGALEK